jgi:hypothetical protein
LAVGASAPGRGDVELVMLDTAAGPHAAASAAVVTSRA